MGFLSRLAEDFGKRYPRPEDDDPKPIKKVNPETGPKPPGMFSFGTQRYGGPQYTDAYGSVPAPSLARLVENYHAIIYAMVARNATAVSRVPMRLLADGSRAQGKPSRACDPIKCSRAVGKRLAEAGKISASAVDQVYEIRNHPLLDVLDNPDPYGNFDREQFIALLTAYQDVCGYTLLVPEGRGWDWKTARGSNRKLGPPEFFWVVYTQYSIPIRMAANPMIDYWWYFQDKIPSEAVIWFRNTVSLRDAYGAAFSPTYASEPYRKQEQEQMAILSQVLSLGPRPNVIASAKDPMMPPGPDERLALEQDLYRKHAGGNAGGVLVTTGAYDFTPVSYNPADIAGNEIAKEDITRMAAIFGQPATYYTVDTNVANLTAADQQHAKFGVEPRCKTTAARFTRLAKMCDPRLCFQHDPVLGQNELEQAQIDKIYVDMGAVTLNELNEEKQYAKKPWGDAPWLPGTLKQPDMITAEHEQGLASQKAQIESGGLHDDIDQDAHEHQKKMDVKQLQAANAKKERALLLKYERTLDLITHEFQSLVG
jgi:hypothetical protein